jgi:hypothetical protein
MAAYKDSPLGPQAVTLCENLKKLFNDPRVHVMSLCLPGQTTFQAVQDTLSAYAQANQQGRLTLLFIMTHGEPTSAGDVRLLMSDTTDAKYLTRALLLRKWLAPWLAEIPGSIALGFVDACHSGNAANAELSALGLAAAGDGTHTGLMASAQADQQSYNFSFTRALIDTWSCPQRTIS